MTITISKPQINHLQRLRQIEVVKHDKLSGHVRAFWTA